MRYVRPEELEGEPLPIPLPYGQAFAVSREQVMRDVPARAHVLGGALGPLCGAPYAGPWYGAQAGHLLCARCLDLVRLTLAQPDWDVLRAACERYHHARFVAEPAAWAALTAAAFPRMAGAARRHVPRGLNLRAEVPARRDRGGRVGSGLRQAVLDRDGYRCRYCGAGPREARLTVDHVVARANGGGDEPANLVTACLACNVGKGTRRLANPPL